MRARDYSPRSKFHVDATILDGWSATRNVSPDHVAKSWLVALPDMWIRRTSLSGYRVYQDSRRGLPLCAACCSYFFG
jgi:hypothetical protein